MVFCQPPISLQKINNASLYLMGPGMRFIITKFLIEKVAYNNLFLYDSV